MIVARVAGSMVSVAMILFSLTHYGSPAITGAVTFASLIPGVLFSPIAGALLDRAGRTRLVIFDYFTSGLALFSIAALDAVGALPAWALIVIVALSSVTSSLSNSGLRSLFPVLVPRHLWQRVNVVDSNTFVVAQLVGPPIAGTMIAIEGGDLGIALIGALFVLAAVATIGIPDPHIASSTSGRLLLDAWHGITYTARNATLRGLALAFTTAKLGTGVMAIVMPVVLLERLAVGPAVVGIAWGVSGAAQFLGALVMGRFEPGPRDRLVIATSFIAYGLALGIFLAPPSVLLILVAMVLTGFLNAPASVTMFTLRQRRTDPAWMGRAFAISMSFSFAGYPVGSAIAGAFAEQSVVEPILFGMATCMVAGLMAWWLIPAHGPEFGAAPASPRAPAAGADDERTRPV